MANEQNLKHFKKGEDSRRNTTGKNKGSFSLTRAIKEYLLENAKDGETYGEKLKKAAVLRAISKSDVLMKEIWDRMDGKQMEKSVQVTIEVSKEELEAAQKALEDL